MVSMYYFYSCFYQTNNAKLQHKSAITDKDINFVFKAPHVATLVLAYTYT